MIRKISHSHVLGITGLIILPLSVFAPILLSSLFALAALLALMSTLTQPHDGARIPRIFLALFGILVVWGALTAAWSVDPGQSLKQAVKLLVFCFGGFVLLRSVRSLEAEQQDLICKSLVIGVAAGLVLLAIEVLTAGVITRSARWALGQPEGFIFSTAFNRATAVLALVVWPAALVFLRRGPRILAPICVIAGCVLLSQLENLSSTIALIGGIAVFAAVYFLGNRIITALAVLVVAGTLAAPLMPSTILSPEVIRETLPSIAAAQFHRALIWDFAAARILERPLRGWGLNSSRTIPGGDKQISRAVRDRTTVAEADEAEANRTPVLDDIDAAPPENWELLPMHPHNAVLQWWLELGLPGAALGAGLILSLLIACRRYVAQRLEQATCVTVIFSATVISLLSYNIWQSWWLAALWLTTVMVTGVLPVAGRDPPREGPAQPA